MLPSNPADIRVPVAKRPTFNKETLKLQEKPKRKKGTTRVPRRNGVWFEISLADRAFQKGCKL